MACGLAIRTVGIGHIGAHCRDCRRFSPDPVGYGGMGTCGKDITREALAIVHHNGHTEIHRQDLLLYPGQAACVEFEAIE